VSIIALSGSLSVKKLIIPILGLAGVLFTLTAAIVSTAQSGSQNKTKGDAATPDGFVIAGQTQCVPQRKGIVAPTVLHPVTDVLVSVGDTVKKDQKLVQLDDDEPQADVRVKKANLENAGIAMREAKRYLASLEHLQMQGAIAEQRIHDARATALKWEADERAAKAAVEVAMAELEHYVVSAPIDGVVNRLEVHPGMVSRPGTTVWGEILDIRELNVRCQLTSGQADSVKVGDTVEVLTADLLTTHGTGRVIFIGLSANAETGKIPALVRIANPDGRLRCEVPVQLRFSPNRRSS
jgi:RND family efflux transporter MFP subunit